MNKYLPLFPVLCIFDFLVLFSVLADPMRRMLIGTVRFFVVLCVTYSYFEALLKLLVNLRYFQVLIGTLMYFEYCEVL